MSFTTDTASGVGPTDSSISFTVTGTPAAGVWTRVTPDGPAVASGSINWISTGGGYVNVYVRSPLSLGAGSYTGTLKVEVCLDSLCATQVSGSPANISVNYLVTGDPDPQTGVSWGTTQLDGTPFSSTQTSAPQFKLRVAVQNPPYPTMYLRGRNEVGDVFASLEFGPPTFTPNAGTGFGEYTVTLKAPAALGSGEFRGSIDFDACYDAACTRPVPGSSYTMYVGFLVLATEGVDYTRRSVAPPQGASEVVWSAANQSFYILSNRDVARFAGDLGVDPQIAAVDPVTLQVGAAVTIPGENLRRLTVTPDGTRLYVGSQIKPFAYGFVLPSLTPSMTLPLGSASPTAPYVVYDFGMLPGQPDSFVASLAHHDNTHGIRVYDNGTSRPNSIAPPSSGADSRWLVPGAAPGTFVSPSYAGTTPGANTLDQLTVDGSGIGTASTAPAVNMMPLRGRPQRAGDRLYTVFGEVFDISTGVLVGTFGERANVPATAILVDETHGRLFELHRGFLWSYDLTTLQRLAVAQIDMGDAWNLEETLILWGSEGVAVANHDKMVVLSGPFFSTYRGEPKM